MHALRSTVTVLDTQGITSVSASSFGMHMLLGRRKALYRFDFLENWIDIPKAEALTFYWAVHHGLRKIDVDGLFATDYYYGLADLDIAAWSLRSSS